MENEILYICNKVKNGCPNICLTHGRPHKRKTSRIGYNVKHCTEWCECNPIGDKESLKVRCVKIKNNGNI